MLTNVPLKEDFISAIFGITVDNINNPQPGVYMDVGFNFNHMIEDGYLIDDYPDYFPLPEYDPTKDCKSTPEQRLDFFRKRMESGEFFGSYGVADNLEQILAKYKPYADDPNHYFCISVQEIRKSEEPEWGGWRWHKWGEYIGVQKPQCEYIRDEPIIESVLVFHVLQVKGS